MEDLLVLAVEELNEKKALELVRSYLASGQDVLEIQNKVNMGLQKVGYRYEQGEYYIADLIVAGELVKQIMNLKGMAFSIKTKGPASGTVLVGTVFEDIHDVGKDIFVSMLQSAGFRTIDLGVDVSARRFVEAIQQEKPDILGISGVLTTIGENLVEVMEAVRQAGLRDGLYVIVGGGTVNEKLFERLEADAYSQDAVEGVKICLEWMKAKRQAGK
ncbi:cobalamin-dependent protein [Alkalibacter rhizosphaerae]|uniref:Cobalamin-dependent protein n=1 Tax=Alkalibacter rhizosphaerae TaxID=2815577 RepID=A0A974XG02_9FIRM|nr:cobalamin-dependent protein [Alkalibacter rhizosphaerae]QSX09167.1 cobalamin-dependent protein [Alkalibacter rhizosphaerae]